METTQEVTEVKEKTGQVAFGFGQINNPTPMWATWIFRTEFVLNKALMYWLASTQMIKSKETLGESILILATIDLIVWGFGRLIGVKKADYEN